MTATKRELFPPKTPINNCEACGGMGRIMFTADEDIDCLRCHNVPSIT